jgi:prepilin-type N-terminal cleavage/methylation domain-containing protein
MNTNTSTHSNDSEAGFGLIEISVVLTIAAVIISMSVVVFGRAAATYQLSQKAQNITWQIERARSAAIKYNQTLTLSFSSQKKTVELTCADCAQAKAELPAMSLPEEVTLSAYPTLTIKGNGTISSTSQVVTLRDGQGRQVDVTITHSGRVVVGDVTEE